MTIRFGSNTDSSSDSLSQTSDSQFLTTIQWRDSRPSDSQELACAADLKTIGMCWKQQCKSLGKLSRELFSTLQIWPDLVPSTLQSCHESLSVEGDDGAIERLTDYLNQRADELNSDPLALLAALNLLCHDSRLMPAQVVGQLWRAVLLGAIAQTESFEEALGYEWVNIDADSLDDPRFLLASGLLPWVCGVLFDDVKGAPTLAKSGRKGIAEQLNALTDSAGCLHDSAMQQASVFLALWRDATVVGNAFDRTCWKGSNARRFANFVNRTTSLLRVDGYLAIEENAACDGDNLASLIDLVGSQLKGWAKAAKTISKRGSITKGTKKLKGKKASATAVRFTKNDAPSWQSDDSQTVCMRSTWAAESSVISILHAEPEPWLELAIDGVPLFSGDWNIDVAENREFLQLEEGWDCCCWYSDGEVDYCEIDMRFDSGPDICRHVMLHRSAQYAVISDVVTSSKANRLDIESYLPLAADVAVHNVTGTREQRLQVGKKVARVYPLVLPQDSGIGTAGEIREDTEHGRALRIAQPSNTGNLFSPVVIDWSEDRRNASAEWVPLTITEAGERDKTGAAGFRLQVGDLHLVLYRQLRSTERYRTVLGMQTENETMIGEFTIKGTIRELLVVQ